MRSHVFRRVVAVTMLTSLAAGCGSPADTAPSQSNTNQANSSSQVSAAQSSSQHAVPPWIEDALLATGPFDLSQRYFPRQSFDDTAYVIGKYGSDPDGDPVFMPYGPNGDPWGDVNPTQELDCTIPSVIKVQQQYVHGRFILVSRHDGPSDFTSWAPTGYAKTATGAAIAASNFLTFGLFSNDELALKYLHNFSDTPLFKDRINSEKPTLLPAAIPSSGVLGVKIGNCGGDTVSLAVATPNYLDDDYQIWPLTLRWRDGMWIVALSKKEEGSYGPGGDIPIIPSLAGFSRVVKQ